MAFPDVKLLRFGTAKSQDLRTGRKVYRSALGSREWKTLPYHVENVVAVASGTHWRHLWKKHRRRSDAVEYGKEVIRRYVRLREAVEHAQQ